MTDPDERLRALEALARQLWFGLAAYRLYPESPDRAGFVATAVLIADAARAALSTGPVDFEVTGEGLSASGIPLRAEGTVARLARVCFERRIERVTVSEAPSPHDLDVVFRVLTTPVEQLDRLGGPSSMLADVRTVGFGRLGPLGTVRGGRPVGEPEADLPPDLASGSIGERVDALLERLRAAIIDDADPAHTDGAVSDRVLDLPPELRTAVFGKLVGEASSDPLAERLIRSMTNAELTRALVDLGDRDGDAVGLAERLAETGVRMPDIVDLTAALAAGHEDASTIIAGLDQIGTSVEDLAPGSVPEALANYLTATASEDVRSMQWLADAEREQATSVGIATLQDYLALEHDRHQFDQVADVWMEAVRAALLGRSDRRVRELLTAVEGIKVPGDDRAFSTVFLPGVLRPDVVGAVMDEPDDVGASSAVQMLEPFGEPGVVALFDRLADEEDRGRRAALLGVLRSLAPGRTQALADRLRDPRWYVVRNAVNVLRHSDDPEALDLLAGAAHHAADAVRREAVWGLVSGGPAALPHLVAAASGADDAVRRLTVEAIGGMHVPEAVEALAGIVVSGRDLGTRRLALERLGTNRAPEALQHLRALADGRRPRLPRSLRRRAHVLANARSSS
jgi:hypothetical protein